MPVEPTPFDTATDGLMGYATLLPGVWYPIENAVQDEDVDANVFIFVERGDRRGLVIEAAWDKVAGWVRADGTDRPLADLGEPTHAMYIPQPQVN